VLSSEFGVKFFQVSYVDVHINQLQTYSSRHKLRQMLSNEQNDDVSGITDNPNSNNGVKNNT